MKKESFIPDIIRIPVSRVLSRYMALTTNGSYSKGLCPFHDDRSVGSFIISDSRNRWYCNSCGESGDAIDFVQKLYGLRTSEAVERISIDFGMTDGTYRNTDPVTHHVTKRPEAKNREYLSIVYNCFVDSAPSLTPAHKVHLLEERHVGGRIQDFFEMPSPTNEFWDAFKARLVGCGLDPNDSETFSGVPGFFLNKSGQVTFAGYSGIGIIQRDVNDLISGLQVRLDTPGKSGRYKLFSSGWAVSGEATNGSSIGQIPDIVWPKNPENIRGVAITEGHFKAISLAKCNYLVLSINGINSYKTVLGEILPLVGPYLGDTKAVDLYLDADYQDNPSVLLAIHGLYSCLSDSDISTNVVSWALELGKGIDDVLIAGHASKLKRETILEFFQNL